MSERPTGLAFFDFDHTLIDDDAGPRFGAYLFNWRKTDAGGFWRRVGLYMRYTPFVSSMAAQAVLYKVGARRRSSLVRSAYRGLRRAPVEPFYQLMDNFVDETVPKLVFSRMVEEIRVHQAAGRRCVIITTGMEPLVRRCLRYFPQGIHLIGCRLEERHGRLTGRVVGPLFGVDKANIMDAYARATGLNLAECWAYSDHWSDSAMLEAVGHPVVVGARGKLRRLAKQRGWTILDP